MYNIAEAISETEITLITRDECVYCEKTKELLKQKDVLFTEFHIGLDVTRDSVVTLWPEAKMLPLVFKKDEYIGGYLELLDYLNPPLQLKD